MHLIWPAIEAKFQGSAKLRKLARRVYLGLGAERQKVPLPYINVNRTGGGPIETYGQALEVYELQFQLYTKHETPDKCLELMRVFQIVFHNNCSWPGGEFIPSEFLRTGQTGPESIDGVYQATLEYTMMVQRVQGVPLPGSVAHAPGTQFSSAT